MTLRVKKLIRKILIGLFSKSNDLFESQLESCYRKSMLSVVPSMHVNGVENRKVDIATEKNLDDLLRQ